MFINSKIRLTILASAFALAAAAPAAFAQGTGTWYQGIHTDPGGTADAPAGRHTQEVMNKKLASGRAALDTGTWYQNIHTDPGGATDAPAARHTQEVMQKKVAPSGPATAAIAPPWVPNY